MATTAYGTNNALAVKLWSRRLFEEALKKCWASKFIGTSSDSVVQILNDTNKGPGDKITVPLRMQLQGAGVQGDGTLEGNEEALSTYSDAVFIDQLRHAVRSAGKMSEQRIPFSVRNEAYQGLRDWFASRIDSWFFNQLGGNTAQTDTRYTGNQATLAPDTNHRIWATGTADESNTAGNVFTINMIDKCIERAKTFDVSTAAGLVPIRPIMVGGEPKYVLFLHPNQVYDLRAGTAAAGSWFDIAKAAITGGKIKDNPIYSGALGEYNGVILHEAYRVPQGVNSSTGATITTVRRAVFCGAQAGIMAFGQNNSPNKMSWVEELFDYKNQLGVSAGFIAGMKKTQFNSLDFGTITVSTYAANH
jgi:N4-gp56 family major capsid protein